MESLLLCPLCAAPLQNEGASLVCPLSHRFDYAKSGYVNLLPGNGGGHGDDREMVASRRRFLSGGYYAPLAEALARVAAPLGGECYLDAGCGEGYYTEALAPLFSHTVGFDLSKDALKIAARRIRGGEFAVGSVYKMPFPAERADLVSCIFAPLAKEEFFRVLKKGGHLLLVIPDENHLFSLKSVLYDTPYKNEPADTTLPGFTLLRDIPLAFGLSLDTPEAIADLFTMTPYYYRTPQAGKERLLSLTLLQTEAAFRILLYKKADMGLK